MTRAVAVTLANRAMPAPEMGKLDRAFAPRAAFVATLHLALLATCSLPLMAVLLPLAPGVITGATLSALALAMLLVVWRSARNLYGHARAGAEVIVMALTQHDHAQGSDHELQLAMGRVATMLPGLGDPVSLRLAPGDPGVGRSLAELDVRGATGAEVLVILRHDGADTRSVVPTGPVRLAAGDVLAIAGAPGALQAARELLAAPPERDGPTGPAAPHD